MTNKERYKEAFGVLRPETEQWEVQPMKNNIRTFKTKRILAVAAVVVILAVAAVGVYAADVGGIQTTLKTWFHGEEVDVDVSTGEDGEYKFEVKDKNGEVTTAFGGGGVEIGLFGKERELTPQEVLDANALDVTKEEDGRMMLYYYDQSYDITDLFSADGKCKVCLAGTGADSGKTVYIEIEKNNAGGYGYSTDFRARGGKDAYTRLGE